MKVGLFRATTLMGVTCLIGSYLADPMVASAASSAPVPFSQAVFGGYGTGTEVQVSAVTAGTTSLANVGQGLSSASVNSAGLTSPITSETGNPVNPAEPASVKAYASGSGLQVGLAGTAAQQQSLLVGKAESVAPPISPVVDKKLGPINLAPLVTATALNGRAATVFDPIGQACTLGQPLSFGRGDAGNVSLLSLLPGAVPVLSTAGTSAAGTTTANSVSDTFLSSNGDGTFGLTSEASEIIAPVTVSLLGVATLAVTVAGSTPNSPVVLDAVTTGNGTGASVKLASNDVINVTLAVGAGPPMSIPGFPISVAQLGPNGLHIDLNTATLGTAANGLVTALTGAIQNFPALGQALVTLLGPASPITPLVTNLLNGVGGALAPIANISLGSLDVDGVPHAIGGSVSSPPMVIGGTAASGAIDLIHLNLGLSLSVLNGTPTTPLGIANLFVGHLETAAALKAPITCPIPVIKTANPASLTAGNDFVYTIQVPDPAKLAFLACSLINLSVVDTISDAPNLGMATFQVLSVNAGGKINQTSTTNATVTWNNLSYVIAPVGQPPNPPVTLTITVAVPKNSPAGTIQDVAVASATAAGCTGGASGVANLGGINGTVLTGFTQLTAPKVNPATATPLSTKVAAGPRALPRTGGEGGLWQPALGIGMLILGGGALGLVRRSRRRLLG